MPAAGTSTGIPAAAGVAAGIGMPTNANANANANDLTTDGLTTTTLAHTLCHDISEQKERLRVLLDQHVAMQQASAATASSRAQARQSSAEFARTVQQQVQQQADQSAHTQLHVQAHEIPLVPLVPFEEDSNSTMQTTFQQQAQQQFWSHAKEGQQQQQQQPEERNRGGAEEEEAEEEIDQDMSPMSPPRWFVCQHCNSRAYATPEEASAHETNCLYNERANAAAFQAHDASPETTSTGTSAHHVAASSMMNTVMPTANMQHQEQGGLDGVGIGGGEVAFSGLQSWEPESELKTNEPLHHVQQGPFLGGSGHDAAGLLDDIEPVDIHGGGESMARTCSASRTRPMYDVLVEDDDNDAKDDHHHHLHVESLSGGAVAEDAFDGGGGAGRGRQKPKKVRKRDGKRTTAQKPSPTTTKGRSDEPDIMLETTPTGQRLYADLTQPVPLGMPSDKDWITPLHCFVRQHCVQVFTATSADVATPSKGKRRPIRAGQVGIRCPYCYRASIHAAADCGGGGDLPPHNNMAPETQDSSSLKHDSFVLDEPSSLNDPSLHDTVGRERGSIYYPTTISSIYNATMNLLQRHLHSCVSIPPEVMQRYKELKADDARSGTSKKYWIDSAKSLGLVDTKQGIRFSNLPHPPLPNLSRQQSSTKMLSSTAKKSSKDSSPASLKSSAGAVAKSTTDATCGGTGGGVGGEQLLAPSGPPLPSRSSPTPKQGQDGHQSIVHPDDEGTSTNFSYHLLCQMQPCVFTDADRLGKRKGLPAGFAGLACRHCYGGYGAGRFFPSSLKTLSDTSKTLNVLHNHMSRCRKCPSYIRNRLDTLRMTHDDERARLKFGSQKAFFAKIWTRLHHPTAASGGGSRSTSSGSRAKKRKAAAAADADPKGKDPAPPMPSVLPLIKPSPNSDVMHIPLEGIQESSAKRPRAA